MDSFPQASPTILRRPALGPFLVGLFLAGVPLGVAFSRLRGRVVSPELLHTILLWTPFTVAVSALYPALSDRRGWRCVFTGSFFASVGACGIVPLVVVAWLCRRWGYDVLTPRGLPVIVSLLVLWSVVVGVLSSLLALTYRSLLKRPATSSGPRAGVYDGGPDTKLRQ